jgi:nitroreductase
MKETTLPTSLQVFTHRRATRHFQSRPVEDTDIQTLLEAARWAPSGYNLQPTHFIVIREPQQRQRLAWACMNQRQVSEAPATIVLAGDKDVTTNHFEQVLEMERQAGAIDAEYQALLRKYVPLAFRTGPLGLNWLWKALLPPLARCFTAVPSIPAVHRRYWLAKQAGLAAMNLMLAAEMQGLATCPMEGFDPRRVRKVLALPRSIEPMIILPLGYPASAAQTKTRLPLQQLVHWEAW